MFLPQSKFYRSGVVNEKDFLLFKRVVITTVNCFHSSDTGYFKAEVYVLSQLPGVCFFQRRTRGKEIAQTFLLQPEL